MESEFKVEPSSGVCVRLTWCSWGQRGGGPGGAVAASCRHLVNAFPLKHRHHARFPHVVGVTQTELDDIP